MNTEQIKGKIKEVIGETQEHLGRLVGSKELEAKGRNRELEGKAQQIIGETKKEVEELAQEVDYKVEFPHKYREERDEDINGKVI